MASPLKPSKILLRSQIRQKIASMLPQKLKIESEMVANRIRKLPQYKSAKSIACFVSIENKEIDTDTLLKYCFEDKKKVYLPRIVGGNGKSEMIMLHTFNFDEIYNKDRFTKSKWGIWEPNHEICERENAMDSLDLDLIIVPGIAFNQKNNRLGQGKGFYDTFFANYKQRTLATHANTFPYLIGIGLSVQFVNDIPIESHDWVLDQIVLGK